MNMQGASMHDKGPACMFRGPACKFKGPACMFGVSHLQGMYARTDAHERCQHLQGGCICRQ